MILEPPDGEAERVMRRWVLPAYFAATSVFCLAVAGYAVLDHHWSGAAVLVVVAIGLAWFADQARQTG